MTNLPVPVGEVFAGKYRVERVLGEGGMGIVVRAHHLELDQPVAVKFLLGEASGDPEGEERFRREARAAAKIQSDHVVRVLDVGLLDSGDRFMVMEYLDGVDLSEELKVSGALPVGVACGYMLEALDAVGHAHQAGIVHRDLKPANLFLSKRNDGGIRVKVLDFGISKTVNGSASEHLSLTKTSAWIGSPLYMSPEQMQSARDVDARADIWSMGAIFYEMLVGVPPFLADSLPQLCTLIISTEPTDIRELRPEVPQEVSDVVMRCLAKDPAARVATTGEVGRIISRYATTITGTRVSFDRTELLGPGQLPDSVTAMRASVNSDTRSAWGGTGKGSQRRPRVFILAGVGAVVLLGAAGYLFAGLGANEAGEPIVASDSAPVGVAAGDPVQADGPKVEDKAPPTEPVPVPEAQPPEPEKPEEKPEVQVAPPAPAPVLTKRSPQPRPAPSAPAPAPAPAPSDGLSDFGGRR